MEWKYKKDITVLPGITLKYGKGGINTTLIYKSSDEEINYKREIEKLKNVLYKQYDAAHEIKSASTHSLTSKDLLTFKELLIKSNTDYSEISTLLQNKNQSFIDKEIILNRLQNSLFRFLFKKKIARISEEVKQLKDETDELREQISLSVIFLEIDAEETYQGLYKRIIQAFNLLKLSEKKWDVTSSKRTNMIAERTSASNTITRSEVEILLKELNLIKTNVTPIYFHNANGGDLYLYPGFLVLHESNNEFAIIDYTEINLSFRQQRFIEDEKVPSDTTVIGKTWYKVNKDGSPDRRFSNNYEIPIVLYGELHFSSPSGLNEQYSFSNPESSEIFAQTFIEYIDALKTAKNLINQFK